MGIIMKLFIQYLRMRKREFLLFLLFALVFLISFLLYHLPAAAVLYPVVICLFFSVIIITLDFTRLYKKHQELRLLIDNLSSLSNFIYFPEADSFLETDYQVLANMLAAENRNLEAEQKRRYTDISDYYTAWAHQIKIPISSMRLKLAAEDSALSRELSMDVLRIEQYVEMVLCYLRLDSGSTDYVIQEYDVDYIIRQAVKRLAPQFISKKIQLLYKPLHIFAVTDEKWLLFVIEQVLSNALKYTRSGSVSITADGNIINICDTGIGIAPEDLPRIFEKGYTGYNGRADKKATGIGLYLCKRICTNLGHQITASSSEDGTCIKINLLPII